MTGRLHTVFDQKTSKGSEANKKYEENRVYQNNPNINNQSTDPNTNSPCEKERREMLEEDETAAQH